MSRLMVCSLGWASFIAKKATSAVSAPRPFAIIYIRMTKSLPRRAARTRNFDADTSTPI